MTGMETGMRALPHANETYFRVNGEGILCIQHQASERAGVVLDWLVFDWFLVDLLCVQLVRSFGFCSFGDWLFGFGCLIFSWSWLVGLIFGLI